MSLPAQSEISEPSESVKAATFADAAPLFILVAAGLVIGAILQEPRIRYSDNDASRWNTVYYLLEYGTYEYVPSAKPAWARVRGQSAEKLTLEQKETWYKIGDLYYRRPADMPLLKCIDMIQLDGKFYSSKPPLLPTCLAGVVWVVQGVTGQTLKNNPWFVMRTTLILVQVIPLVIMLWLLRGHLYRLTDSPFCRHFCMATAALATYLTPWSMTLNNHTIAACTGFFALHAALRIGYDGRREWYWFALSGFFAAFTAGTELPSGLLAISLFVVLVIKDVKRTLLIGLPLALVLAFVGLYANYQVTGELTPAYTQVNQPGGAYDYEGSYWRKPGGTDALDEPKHIYLTHMLVGHHGFFSLTPVFLLSLAGMVRHLFAQVAGRRLLAGFVLLLSVAVMTLYTFKTHNYGGACQGFRWLFWIIPLWLLFLPCGVHLFEKSRTGRAFCYLLLAVSVMTVGYGFHLPWPARSWLHVLYREFGWINY